MGWLVPLEVLAVDGAAPGTGVISTTPTLHATLRRFLNNEGPRPDLLPPEWWGMWPFIRTALPEIAPRVHSVLACDAESFFPAPDLFPVTGLREDDPHVGWFNLHFDGPVFTARDPQGMTASWAAIKCKSCDVWEMAVVTEEKYRGRGLARSVVSHATRAAFAAGKVAMYLHEISNLSSAHVAQAVGYHAYGHELTCEAGRILPKDLPRTVPTPITHEASASLPFI
jgi:hypothetical protein